MICVYTAYNNCLSHVRLLVDLAQELLSSIFSAYCNYRNCNIVIKSSQFLSLFCAGYTEEELWLSDSDNVHRSDLEVVSLDELISGFMCFCCF